MIRRPPRSTQSRSSAASDVYKRQSVDTVGRGAGELEAGISPDDRVRAVGAGRRSVEAADPGLVAAVEALVAPESRGDPQSPLRMDDQVQRPAGRGADHPGTSGGCADGRPTACLLYTSPSPR